MRYPRIFRLAPLFLVSLVILASAFFHPVWAVQFVGYPNPNNTCSNVAATCGGCNGACVSNPAIGEAVQAPFTGKLVAVSFLTGATNPIAVDIFTFPVGTAPVTFVGNYVCGQSPQSNQCTEDNGGNVYTLQDRETLTGLTVQTYFTVSLANPVSVIANQWVFMGLEAAGSQVGWLGSISSGGTTAFIDTGINVLNIQNGQTDTTAANGAGLRPGGAPVGGSFSTTATQQFVTQCYGNCGTPAITLANTNSTHGVNWNNSITLMYIFQSNINGFLNNITTNLAKNYPNGFFAPVLGFYAVTCPIGQTPFSQQCPGSAIIGGLTTTNTKGRASLNAGTQYTISANQNQWYAVALSFQIAPEDVNDTNTNVALSQAPGTIPAAISQTSALGNSKIGIWAWITGNVVIGTPSTPGITAQSCAGLLDCLVPQWVFSLCNSPTTACVSESALLWAAGLAVFFSFFTFKGVGAVSEPLVAKLPIGEIFTMWLLIWIFVMSGLTLLFVWVPIFFFFVISLMYGKHTGHYL